MFYVFEGWFSNNGVEFDKVWTSNGLRPVINLKADVEYTIDEDGTYVITTN